MDFGSPPLRLSWDQLWQRELWSCSQLAGAGRLAAELGVPRQDRVVINAALLRWGPDAPARLAGPFAVVVADPLTRSVHLIRDHLGQFPLHWGRIDGGVVVSMDLEAVLEHPGVDDTVDLEAAALLYARAWLPLERRTPFRGVGKVAPGTVLTLHADGRSEHRYWDPAGIEPGAPGSPEELRALLAAAVADALPVDGEVGAHVSGGLDSTAVAVLAEQRLRLRGDRLAAAYSWSPPGRAASGDDERRLVEAVAAGQGWAVTYVADDPALLAALAAEDPLRRPQETWLRESWVARHAAAQGISVLLSGWGGDEAVSFDGRNLVPWLAGRGRLLPALRELRARATVLGDPLGGGQLARRVGVPMVPPAARRTWRRLRPRTGPATALDVRTEVWGRHSAAVAEAVRTMGARLDAARSPHEYQVRLLTSGHLAARCESWAAAGARAGVQYRYPLLDRRVVEFALRCGPSSFRAGGWDRALFRRAIEPLVPRAVAWNPRKVEPVLVSRILDQLGAGSPPRTHPRVIELAELERLQQEADRTTYDLFRSPAGAGR